VASELSPQQLITRCDPAALGFATTAEVTAPETDVVQERALAALRLGMRIGSYGHNVYVMGLPGSGRHAVVRQELEREAATRAAPDDWCYVNRFDDPQRPRALRLPCGRGVQLKADMRELVRDLRAALPEALESDAYRRRRAEVEREFEERVQRSFEAVQQQAEQQGLSLVQAPDGFGIVPMRNGAVLPSEQFEQLPETERQAIRARIDAVGEVLRAHLGEIPRWQRERHRRRRELDREVTAATVRVQIEELRAKYADCPGVLEHLQALEGDLVENARSTFHAEPMPIAIPGLERVESQARFGRYDVNVMVDGRGAHGAPVVYEGNPTYQNILGQTESVAQLGALVTDFMLVRPGALHRANGGFLILDAERLLTQPFAWDALKHALFERCIRVESLGQRLSLISTVSLEPERIPLQVRVVLVGTRQVYDLLCEYDVEFAELFKVPADFDDVLERTPENTLRYARMIAATARCEASRPLDAAAVARLIEHGARLAGDSRKLSTHLRSIQDCVREASHFALAAGREVVQAVDVQRALDEARRRLARAQEETLDAIRLNSLLIDCDGEAVGQVNGLSVLRVGGALYGQPSRITATARIGDGEVVDIEREVKLGGAIHSKGVLILAALIGARFGTAEPLSLQASLVFEQSYGGVEGDSASLAEACTLLSAIAGRPLRQNFGVTGSINQHGAVQVIGAVNEKIEGFFQACRQRGLTGTQGVILPADNAPHLMLHAEVIEAVAAGQFHVHAVRTLDEAIPLLTGLPAGERGADGHYPPGSFNALVDERLRAFARGRQEFAREAKSAAKGSSPSASPAR
jgi:predicted ATP-dependent protease